MAASTPDHRLDPARCFADRHIGTGATDQTHMLGVLGYPDLDALMDAAIPERVRTPAPSLPDAMSEQAVLATLRAMSAQNPTGEPLIGLGYHSSVTPAVIRRRMLESPAWYTAYTPYQPEISQGRLEALVVFQTMITDLTGLDMANASMLDEATAAAEAISLMRRAVKGKPSRVLVDADLLPQTLAVIRTRCEPVGVEVVEIDPQASVEQILAQDAFGIVLAYPGQTGAVRDHRELAAAAHERGMLVTATADPMALTLLEPPGAWGADIAAGNTQRFGVPIGYGGPHAGYLAVRSTLTRSLPGRLVGLSVDDTGYPAYRLALQTREQHIRREKATSNICTAQVLLAVMAAMYAVYHGPAGLTAIATDIADRAAWLAAGLATGGVALEHDAFVDTVVARVPGRAREIVTAAQDAGVLLRYVDA
ncbi:MAG: glycine dehydrogenase, partial [Actinomycetales bacterium]